MGIGEWAALFTALMWTISSLLWGKVNLSALGINLFKNILAVGLLAIQLVVTFAITREPAMTASATSWGWLSLSGLVGIVIGDTFYFRSLQILGPRRALMMATLSPLFAAMLGWIMLREQLQWLAVLGILVTIIGIAIVIRDRSARKEAPGLFPGNASIGILFGVLSASCQAFGGVFSKKGMADCDPVEATFVRLLMSAIAMLVIVVGRKQLSEIVRQARKWETIKFLVPATLIGTWLGIWFSQISFKEASSVAIATTLMSTSPILAIPFIWKFDGHRSSFLALLGSVIAITGIFLAVAYG